jgi:hypothetical protein
MKILLPLFPVARCLFPIFRIGQPLLADNQVAGEVV